MGYLVQMKGERATEFRDTPSEILKTFKIILLCLSTLLFFSCYGQTGSSPIQKKSQHAAFDYFDPNSSTTFKIEEVEYRFADENIGLARALYLQKDFSAVEKKIMDLLSGLNEEKSIELSSLYDLLSMIPDDKHIDFMHRTLNEWCEKHPLSHVSFLVRGGFFINWAWSIRGTGFADTVSEKTWPLFNEKLNLAKKDLEKSFTINPKDPNSSRCLITVSMGLGLPEDTMEQYFQNAITACPSDFKTYIQKMMYLLPKWHGTNEKMLAFARESVSLSNQYPCLGIIQAMAFTEMQSENKQKENILGREDIWPEIEGIYKKIFERYPDNLIMQFYYAYYAGKAKKYDIALTQFELIGNRWIENTVWYAFETYRNVRAFTYYKIGENLLFVRRLYQPSIDFFQRSIRYKPTDQAFYGLGLAYWYTGNSLRDVSLLKKAETSLQKAIELNPDHKKAKEQLQKLQGILRRS